MRELCGDFLVINPYTWVRNACVSFDSKIRKIRVKRTPNLRYRQKKHHYTIITHGLASAHTHLGLYPIRSSISNGLDLDGWVRIYAWPWEKYLRENKRLTYVNALLCLEELVKSGVTAFADMHFNEEEIGKATERVGVKGDLSVALMDGGVFESFEEGLKENLYLVNKFRESKLVNVRLGPCTPRLLTPEQFRNTVELAEELGVGIHTHLAEVPLDLAYLRKKWDMGLKEFIKYVKLTEVNSLVAHGIWATSVIDDFSTSRNVYIVHPPRSNVLLGDGRLALLKIISEGIKVALGVDVAPTYRITDDMSFAIALHYQGLKPISSELIFSLGSEGGYRSLGLGSGDLVVGETADIVVWRVRREAFTHPIASIVLGNARVSEAYVNGELILSDNALTNIPENEMENARKELNEYLSDFIKNYPYSQA